MADLLSLGLLLCGRAEVECLAGDSAAALTAYAEARGLAEGAQAGPASEIGQALARVSAMLEGATA